MSNEDVWSDERIREAFVYDGGEAEYHDPINGAKEQRRFAGEVFDKWLAAHDAELLRRPITDAHIDAAMEAWTFAPIHVEGESPAESARRYMLAALEAARELSE